MFVSDNIEYKYFILSLIWIQSMDKLNCLVRWGYLNTFHEPPTPHRDTHPRQTNIHSWRDVQYVSNSRICIFSADPTKIYWKPHKLCYKQVLHFINNIWYSDNQYTLNPIPAGVLENQDMPSKFHVWCPNMTNDTSLESSCALLLESAKKFANLQKLYSKNVCKKTFVQKMKNYTFLKSPWPCDFKYAKSFAKF